MSLELTKLKSENMIYQIVGDPYRKVLRRIWRDFKSYKWILKVSIISYFPDFSEETEFIRFECKNYTRDTLSRRFREWREKEFSSVKELKLEKIEQFFFTD